MNEELQTTLHTALKDVIESSALAKDFIMAELPDVIQQLLLWKATISGIAFLIFLVLGVIVFVYARRYRQPYLTEVETDRISLLRKKGYGGRSYTEDRELERLTGDGIYAFTPWALYFLAAACGALAIANLTWLQILIAPKIYLLEYAAYLVRSAT